MDKKAWAKELIQLADSLDSKGLSAEAAELDSIVQEAMGGILVDPYGSGQAPSTTQGRDWYGEMQERKMATPASPEEIQKGIQRAKELDAIAQKVSASQPLEAEEQTKWDKFCAQLDKI